MLIPSTSIPIYFYYFDNNYELIEGESRENNHQNLVFGWVFHFQSCLIIAGWMEGNVANFKLILACIITVTVPVSAWSTIPGVVAI